MVFKRFYIQVIFRVLLIFANCLWLAFEVYDPPNIYTLVFLGSLLIIQTLVLVRYVNKTNRELSRFFSSLRDQDSSFSLVPEDSKGTFRELARVLNQTSQLIRDTRIEKEKQYRYLQFIISHIDIGLLSFRPDGQVVHYNPAAQQLLDTGELKLLKTLNRLHPGFEKTLSSLKPGQSKILTITQKTRQYPLLIRMTEFLFDDESLKLVSIQDLQAELDEQELISWKRLIRALNHEVMNSLTPIRTLSHAINRSLMEIPPEKIDEGVFNDIQSNTRLIEQRSTSLMDFVRKYRDITRIDEIAKETIDVKKLINEVTGIFREDFRKHNIHYNAVIDPPDLNLNGDMNLLKQVLINLVKNALEALQDTEKGELDIDASIREKEVLILVKDNGSGILPEHFDDIFTPFFSTKRDGSGIGLSFSKHIIRLHGGNMSVWSEPGRGTIVTLKFPIHT
jgi:two-component system nitrogen regulation sensor histidine kinase NtrY